MGNIERWTIYVCPDCGSIGREPERPGHGLRCMTYRRDPVEVVPRDQLQGAVEALEIAYDALLRTTRDTAFGYEDKKVVEDYVKRTLNDLRGR